MFLPNCGRASFPSPVPYRSARPAFVICGLQSRSIGTARRSQTVGSTQIVPISTQNGDHICKPSETSHSLRRVSGRNMTLWCPRTLRPRTSAASGSRSRSFSTGYRPKRTSSLLRRSVPAPVYSFTSSHPLPSLHFFYGSTIDSHQRESQAWGLPCLSLWERWLSEARTERVHAEYGCQSPLSHLR